MVDIDKLYAGIQNAETGSQDNPYIRTKDNKSPGGSTAFGPVQVTYNLAKGAYQNGYLSPESQQFFKEVMEPRYQAMLEHGNNKGKIPHYNPEFDYGGTAQFDPTQYGQQYEQFSKEIMSGIAKEAGGNEQKFIEKWRGKTSNQDYKYFQKVEVGKKIFSNEITPRQDNK